MALSAFVRQGLYSAHPDMRWLRSAKTFVSRILTELDLRDRGQAVVHAYQHGPGT